MAGLAGPVRCSILGVRASILDSMIPHTDFAVAVNQLIRMETSIDPGTIDLDVDIRTLPGEDAESVTGHLREALGDLLDEVVSVHADFGDLHPGSVERCVSPGRGDARIWINQNSRWVPRSRSNRNSFLSSPPA